MALEDASCSVALVARRLGARFDHVAHAARRIRDLLPIYGDLLGREFVHGGANPRVGYRAIQIQYTDGTRGELLEPLEGSPFLDRFFERNPYGGLHDPTFKIDDVRSVVAAARVLGLMVTGGFYENPRWQKAFLHPRGAYGTRLQIVQSDPEYPPPKPGLNLESLLRET